MLGIQQPETLQKIQVVNLSNTKMKKEEVAVVSFSEMAGDVIPSCEIEERRISTRSSKQSETTTTTNPILKVNSMKSFKNLC